MTHFPGNRNRLKLLDCDRKILVLEEWELQFEVDPYQFNLRLHHFPQFLLNVKKKKIFKSGQVSDWLAKWLIMLGFIDLRQLRVFRRSNVGLVGLVFSQCHFPVLA